MTKEKLWISKARQKKTNKYKFDERCLLKNFGLLRSKNIASAEIKTKIYKYLLIKFVQVIDNIPSPTLMHDAKFNIAQANRAYTNLVEKTCDELSGKYYGNFFPLDDGKPKKCICKLAKIISFKDKKYRVHSYPMEDPTKQCYQLSLHVFEDITEELYFKALAKTDQLTELKNRHALKTVLKTECGRAIRYNAPLSILFLDVDHFKKYNDEFGHPEGDIVLKKLGNMLRENLRLPDLVFRFGGEEIIVLLPNTKKPQAVLIAERLREDFKNIKFLPKNNKTTVTKTLSIGVAQFNKKMNPKELIEKADNAMYKAKKAGRDRVKS